MQRIYFDNAASTPLLPEVVEVMHQSLKDNFGNPSSIHFYGRNAKAAVESARKTVAEIFNCSIGEIFFTSCATESNNFVIDQCVKQLNVVRIISSPTEHPCVLRAIERHPGTEVIMLDVDTSGKVDLDQLSTLLSDGKKTLVSLMYVNNELGTILPIQEVSAICRAQNALFHSDAVQAIGKMHLDLDTTSIDFISASAHKFHGPKGVGFVYINGDNTILPMIVGGAQERNMRAGTENISGISGLAKALELAVSERDKRAQTIKEIKSYFIQELEKNVDGIIYNGDLDNTLYTILNVSFPESTYSDMLMFNLDINGICASAGSACSSGVEHDSPVLAAIKHDPKRKAIRFSFSHLNTKEEVDLVIEKITSFVNK